jgi:3-polyprenyl-4-hydroxybenzoate decarboxylase
MSRRISIAITGASGAIYATRTMAALLDVRITAERALPQRI